MGIYKVTGIFLIIGGVGLALFGLAARAIPAIETVPISLATPIAMTVMGVILVVWHRRQQGDRTKDAPRGSRRRGRR